MNTQELEERAKAYADKNLKELWDKTKDEFKLGWQLYYDEYIKIATEQKAIDDAELARLKEAWEKEAEITHDDKKNYQQGYHDAIDKACEWLKEDDFDDIIDLADFRNAMEE